MAKEPGQVELVSARPRLNVIAWLGQDAPAITAGYGGFELIARPRRLSVTRWVGREPFQLRLPLVVDGYATQDSIETELSRIERMALPYPNPGGEPPLVVVNGPVPHSDLVWIIESIEWGVSWRRRKDGHRVRQEVVITFRDWVAEDLLGKGSAAARARERATRDAAKKSTGYRIYVVKRGDTLPRIAAIELGDANRWREIARINNIRDPMHLKVGMKLRIPRS